MQAIMIKPKKIKKMKIKNIKKCHKKEAIMRTKNNQAEWNSVNAIEAKIENVLLTYHHKLKISTNI